MRPFSETKKSINKLT